MEAKIISKKDIPGFLDRLIQTHAVYAPLKQNGLFAFGKIQSGTEAALDYTNTKISPKGILFPASEALFSFQAKDKDVEIEMPSLEGEKDQILFGLRPCDAQGVGFMDKIFISDPVDPYYQAKRAKTVIVGLGCKAPHNGCFCTTLGGSPCGEDGSDLLLIDIGDQYLVQVLSEKGADLTRDLSEADTGQTTAAAGAAKQAEEAMNAVVDLEGSGDRLTAQFDDPVWDTIAEKCIACGICTYLCPTCHCFDICEEAIQEQGTRIRIWDSCQYPLFTKEASGHNPRSTQAQRWRQRIMHKFKYLPDEQDMLGCTGCGRCVTECPVNLDIRQVLSTLLNSDESK